MSRIKLTRMELLKIRKRKKLAEKGHKLLSKKRDTLVMNFFKVMKEVKEARKGFADQFVLAQNALKEAEAVQGETEVERLSLAASGGLELDIKLKQVMGVEIPELQIKQVEQPWFGYYESTVAFDDAVARYRNLLPQLIQIIEKQLALKKIANEIKKVKRRVNSLEYIAIPRLEEQEKKITLKLDELERENFTRLKKIKSRSLA
jgi:V/A-type H+-transporting ATPase subunit D